MAFTDPDPVEEQMNLRVEEMTPNELVTYLKTYQEAFGRRMAVEGKIERAVFGSLQRIYGKADAGRIVKWACYKYHGVWNGEVVGFTSFSKGRKWWVDKMHQELQERVRQDEATPAERVGVGAKRLSEL